MPGPGYHISGKEIEVYGSGSPRFFPVIRAWLAGLPRFPAPSAVSQGFPVLNPKSHGTFSWPASKSRFTPFLPARSVLHFSKLLRKSPASLLHLAFWLPKLRGKGTPKALCIPSRVVLPCMAAMPGFKSQRQSFSAASFPTPPTVGYTCQPSHMFPAFLGCHSKYRQVWPHGVAPWRGANHLQALTHVL